MKPSQRWSVLGFMACLSIHDLPNLSADAGLMVLLCTIRPHPDKESTYLETRFLGRFSSRRDFSVHPPLLPSSALWFQASFRKEAAIYERRATSRDWKFCILLDWKVHTVFGGRQRKMKINCNSYLIMRCKLMLYLFFSPPQVRDTQNLLRAHFFQTG